jgi:eukaryotic-like serine/threonine-protein kinase
MGCTSGDPFRRFHSHMSVIPPRSSEFLTGSSLGFVKPMPQRGGESRGDQGDSAEFDVAVQADSAQTALDLWRRLLPDSGYGGDASFACAGLMLGHFQVEEQIGRGGMGAVFRAVDTRLDREVALKVLAGTQSGDRSAVERFLNEARAAARLDHDNVARVFFVGEEHGLHFIAFEFIHGANVRQVIDARGPLPPADAVNYTLQIAHALRHIANAGVVHRDVKPSNIIITPAGRAKLVDLGLARNVDPDASRDLTVDGTTLGTFDYISPEQAKDPRNVDIRSDVYSLGCTLYHMLSGEPPYPGGTMLQKLLDHQHKDVPDVSARNRSVPPELSAVVRKMMASDPADRYQSADELISDLTILAHAYGLRPIASEAHIWATPQALNGSALLRRYRAWLATAALLLVGVLAIDFVQSLTHPSGAPANQKQEVAAVQVVSDDTGSEEPVDVATPVPPPNLDSASQTVEWGPEESGPLSVTLSEQDSGGAPGNGIALEGAQAPSLPLSPLADTFSGADFNAEPLDPPLLSGDSRLLRGEQLPAASGSAANEQPANVSQEADVIIGDDPPRTAPPAAVASRAPFVVRTEGRSSREFATLEAACTFAPHGSVIELNFDGPSAELQRPIKIEGKRLRLLRAAGRSPVIRFGVPPELPSAEIIRMISVIRGSLEVYDVGFQFEAEVSPQFFTDSWVLLSLSQAEEVRLRGVLVTIENPQGHPAAVVELVETSTGLDDRMPDAMERPPVRFNIEDSFFRGQADLFVCENVEPARIELSNVALGLSGSIMHLLGMDAIDVMSDMANDHRIELGLRHVTALLGREVLRFEINAGREVPRVAVSADNSVLVSPRNPLVSMTCEVDEFDARQRLEWSGGHSFIESQDPVWRIAGPINDSSYSLSEWNDLWRQGRLERVVGTNLLPRDRSVPYDQMTRSDLRLVNDPEVKNPATEGASDGTDAGVQWDSARLPRPDWKNVR